VGLLESRFNSLAVGQWSSKGGSQFGKPQGSLGSLRLLLWLLLDNVQEISVDCPHHCGRRSRCTSRSRHCSITICFTVYCSQRLVKWEVHKRSYTLPGSLKLPRSSTGITRIQKCDMQSRNRVIIPILQRLANNVGRITANRSVYVVVATTAVVTLMATVATCFRYPPYRGSLTPSTPSSHTILSTSVDRSSRSALQKATTEASSNPQTKERPRQTPADAYFRRHGQLPEPNERHVVLSAVDRNPNSLGASAPPHGILVIGDVHGCMDELLLLHQAAVRVNDNRPFDHVILVGDLGNKGPHSAAVIRHVRTNASQNWRSIRGNHDNAALTVALHETQQKDPAKYAWIHELSDDDVQWLAQLPYTIRIPASYFSNGNVVVDGTVEDTLIVHAGLIPGVPLAEQSIPTMVTLRELPQMLKSDTSARTETHPDGQDAPISSWASHWKGPERIIFGHDAKRGLQQTDYCIGLDTGAVYGKQLSGIILPQRQLVQVQSLRVYCPIQEK
jgi:bis(5'-nucleosyl)-tetraphosphatase (symmetrical)